MRRAVPSPIGADHGVEHGKQLAHAGHQGDLGEFAGADQAVIEGLDGRVASAGRQGSHVEHAADLEATALDAPTSLGAARVVGHGRDADQGSDVATAEAAELGQLGDQGGTGDRADAAGRLQQPIEFAEVLSYVGHHLAVDVVELGLDDSDDGLDARMQALGRDLQPLALAEQHGEQLTPACDPRGQPLLLRVDQRAQEAPAVVAAQQHGGKLGEHARVHRVGLDQAPHRFGEVAGLARVDHRHRQARGLQRAGQLRLVAASGLHHHQRHLQGVERRGQRGVRLGLVVEPLGLESGAQHADIHVGLGHVDAYHH
jgi:hypothetical protein